MDSQIYFYGHYLKFIFVGQAYQLNQQNLLPKAIQMFTNSSMFYIELIFPINLQNISIHMYNLLKLTLREINNNTEATVLA